MAYGNSLHKSIYYSSPYPFKNVIASIFGCMESINRYGTYYKEALSSLKESQYHSNHVLVGNQLEAVNDFIDRATKYSPFYQQPEFLDLWKDKRDVSNLPVLTKENVRVNIRKILPINLDSIHHRWSHTSGTTGKSLVFPLSKYCFQREYAFRAVHYSWSGADLDSNPRIAMFAGHPVTHRSRSKPPFWVRDFWNNWLIFSSYHMTEESLRFYAKELESFLPHLVVGYPSSIYLLALAYRKYAGKKLHLKGIYTASETLTQPQRKAIEEIFQVKVFNWYGNSEMVANIVECEMGELHLKLEHSYVEILDEGGSPAKPGSSGRLVCTGFGNEAFPLIRYEVGDVVTLSDVQQARCARGGVLIDRIEGRIEDYVVTPDGRYVGRLDHIFKDSENVVESQIRQEDPQEVVMRIVRTEGYSKGDEDHLIREARTRLGDEIKIRFEYVSKIGRSRNGKYKFIDSRIPNLAPFGRPSSVEANVDSSRRNRDR